MGEILLKNHPKNSHANIQPIYAQQVSIINGVAFTPKEFDILACIINGRGTKATGRLLYISPKTVEVHTRNIMLKIECNSRESIIDFIEKSPQFLTIKKHYFNILAQANFEKNLQIVSKLIRKRPLNIFIIYWPKYEDKDSYIYQLRKDLETIGINLNIIIREDCDSTNQFFPKLISQDVDHVIYCLPKLQNNAPSNMENILFNEIEQLSKSFERLKKLSFLSVERSTFLNLKNTSTKIGLIEFGRPEIYHHAFFRLLKTISPNVSIEQLQIDAEASLSDSTPLQFLSQQVLKDTENQLVQSVNITSEHSSKSKMYKRSAWGTIGLFFLFSTYQHQIEKVQLLKELTEVSNLWFTIYEPHFNEVVSQASFYQIRSNALDVDKARIISAKLDKVSLELNKNLQHISEKMDFIKSNMWIISPINWSLKNKIIRQLEESKHQILIATSLNQASKYMRDENFSSTVKEITENAQKQAEFSLGRENDLGQKKNYFKQLMSIILNIKSIARRKLAEDKEVTKQQYISILKNIYNELAMSINNYNSLNFNTYIVIHYIILLIVQEEPIEKTRLKLEAEAEHYLTRAAEIAPNEPMVLAEQALHFMKKEEYDRALLAFNTSLNLNPNNVGVLHNRSELYLTMGEKYNNLEYCKKAYVDAQKANDLKPHDCDILKLVVWSGIYAQGCSAGKEKYDRVFRPLCTMKRKDWDDISAIRNESEKILESKFVSVCRMHANF